MAKATKTVPKSVQQQPSTTGTPKKAANAKTDAGDSAGSSSAVSSVSKQNSPSKGKKMNSKNSSPKKGNKSQGGKTVPSSASTDTAEGGSNSLITCKHLTSPLEFLKMYHQVVTALSSGTKHICKVCGSAWGPIYACLQCVHFACWRGHDCHFSAHNTDVGHALAVEATSYLLYCVVCRVFIWNEATRAVFASIGRGRIAGLFRIPGFTLYGVEEAGVSVPNTPTGEGNAAAALVRRHCVGMRGLYNLGNTCFMNSVLQILLHCQLLREYFHGAKENHSRQTCRQASCREGNSVPGFCTACEMDSLFNQMYSGETRPISPHRLLLGIWRSSRELVGYEQQDAHEFFVALRYLMHVHLGGSMFACGCVVHRIFAGVLQSDVTCAHCQRSTETFDPFLDVSLEVVGMEAVTLDDCLWRFTRPESLAAHTYSCGGCHQSHQNATKQLSFRSTPPVLALHLKRFEHEAASEGSSKVETMVAFPENLSLDRYLRDTVGGNDYQLFGTISHVGTLDSGHYTAFVRYRDDWFWVDDACVHQSSLEEVLSSHAYMLFYQKNQQQQPLQ